MAAIPPSMQTASPAPAAAFDSKPAELPTQAYGQLRALARARLRSGRRETLLDTTAPVYEAYLRIVGVEMNWSEQRSFMACASRTMRSVIVDFMRKRQADYRGGDVLIVALSGAFDISECTVRRDWETARLLLSRVLVD